jgi:hypothetical protein
MDNENDMKMYPIMENKDVYKIKRKLKEPLQKLPFVKVLLGSRGSGKTASLVNELMRKNMMGDKKGEEPIFEDIIVFSSTLGSDETSRHLVKKATTTYDSYDDYAVKEIMEYQKDKDKKDRRHILIIADDIAPMLKPNDFLFKLCSVHRHYLISIYFLIQSPRLIPPIVRNCYTSMYVYRMPNAKEQEKIFEDLSFLGDKDMVKDMYEYATNKPYQFLMVDALKNECWKWGACSPEFLWKKYNDNGGFNPRFSLNTKQQKAIKDDKIKNVD